MEKAEVAAALTELTKGLGVFSTDLLRDLNGKLDALRRCWSITVETANGPSNEAVRRLMIGNLRLLIDQLEPRSAHQGLSPERRIKQYKNAISVFFNIPRDEEGPEYRQLRNRTLTDRRAWLAKNAPVDVRITVSVGQDDLKDAIDKMAALIIKAGYKPVTNVEHDLPDLGGDAQPAWVADFNAQYGEGRASSHPPAHAAPVYVNGGWVVLTFIGEQDSTNLYFYRNSMVDLYRLGKILRLIVAIELEGIDPGFTGIMLGQYSLSRGNGAALRLVTTNQEIYRFFKRAGIARRFDWFPDVSTAINMPAALTVNNDDGLTEVIEFSHEFRGDFAIVRMSGELDLLITDQLEAFLRNLVASGCLNFVLDLSGVTWIDTAGVRPIVSLQHRVAQRNGQTMIAVGNARQVRNFFELVGFFEPIFDTVDEALESAGRPNSD